MIRQLRRLIHQLRLGLSNSYRTFEASKVNYKLNPYVDSSSENIDSSFKRLLHLRYVLRSGKFRLRNRYDFRDYHSGTCEF